ncbi:hypothetical protein CDV58_08310, partial [Aspergillus fumigatus]
MQFSPLVQQAFLKGGREASILLHGGTGPVIQVSRSTMDHGYCRWLGTMSADQIVRYRTLPEIALHCHSRSNQRQMWNYKRGQTEYDIEPSITVGNYIPDKRPIAGNLHLPIHAGDYLAPTKARIVVSKSSGSLPRISPRRGDTTAVSPARIAAHAVAHSLDRFNP